MLDKTQFDKWSGSYDESIKSQHNTFPFDGYYNVLAAIVSIVQPSKNLKVIDVGIGTGLLSEELYKQSCIIHGVDFSHQMIEKAKIKIPNGVFDTCDISQNHFGRFNAQKYDRIISSYFFHHLNLQQKTQFIKRTLQENLEPNGKIIIADIGFQTEKEFNDAHQKYQNLWDEDEFYFCGDTIISHLHHENINAEYTQISSCAGIITCDSPM